MKKINILHITNWYPHKSNPYEALWVKRHIDTISPYCNNHVVHIDIRKGRLKLEQNWSCSENNYIHFWLPFKIFRIWELMYALLLLYTFARLKISNYSLINFHIAYPICTYIHWVKLIVRKPMLINEHWSEYRNNFGIKKANKTSRIRRIFKNNIPIAVVSKSLYKDIYNFSLKANFPHYILPNVVEFDESFPIDSSIDTKTFFMMSQWKYPKDPILALKGFKLFLVKYPNAKLTIAGYGPQKNLIIDFIKKNRLEKNISFIGVINSTVAKKYFANSSAFIHSSSYETFSVVCAEALSYGCPVIASKVGGISEYVNEKNGVLVEHDSFEEELFLALDKVTALQSKRNDIAKEIRLKFGPKTIGSTYFGIIKNIIGHNE
ncbi:Glycosyltransferase involved in cell wall bisynthesis [Reichenbachiella faecimaris]|uniref:Glycosyltransferase involved in cell wall bisynthesis n=1 Tax=Reichenbachiella faecimaris TaxID=692418 RepID=A0A1W2GIV7_REIFA|nr:glycosyltransferase family 4 protein [Reichenbachiella faecimaris]SMD36474.1 Glycosyltransferase involved in cell wall bisynthesis [Reichenbachiella faecimaris]